jgi:hypothetical protein
MRRLFCLVVFAAAWVAIAWAQPTPVISAIVTTGGEESFGSPTEQTSGPVVYDLTGDGEKELIVTGRKDIWVLNYSEQDPENAIFHWQAQNDYKFCSPVTIAHLTPDGYPWVVVGASEAVRWEPGQCPNLVNDDCPAWTGHAPYPDPDCHYDGDCYHWQSIIHAWKIVGTNDDPHPSDVIMNARLTTPAAADVNGDLLDELCFVGNGSYGVHDAHTNSDMYSTVGVHFFKFDNGFVEMGDTRKEIPWGLQAYTGLNSTFRQIAQTVPAAGDLDGDGLPEFVVQCLWRIQAYTFASNPNGALLWEDSTYNVDRLCMPAKCFINFGTHTSGETHVSVPWPYTDYSDPQSHYTTGDAERSPGPVLADLDGDGQLDVFVQTSDGGGYVWKFDGQNGTFVARNFYESYGVNWAESPSGSELGLCDDHNDGHPRLFETLEVLNGESDPTHWLKTRRWEGTLQHDDGNDPPIAFPYVRQVDFYPLGDLYTLALLPSAVGPAFTVDIAAYDSVIFERTDAHDSWQWYLGDHGGPVQSGITATDLDHDGFMECVLSNRINDTQTHLYALETDQPYNPETIEWSGYRNNPQHTGLYAQPVHGTQVVRDAVWQGRIILTDAYTVTSGQTLTIKPGTVVEFDEDSDLIIRGELSAEGTDHDSIYFKPNGTEKWGAFYLYPGSHLTLDHCVIHGGSYVGGTTFEGAVNHCHIYDMRTDSIVNADHSEKASR